MYTQKAYEIAPSSSLVMYNLACFHAMTGNKEEALTWLEKAVDGGFYSPNHMAKDSDLDSLRDDPRYEAALAKATDQARGEGAEKGELFDRINRMRAEAHRGERRGRGEGDGGKRGDESSATGSVCKQSHEAWRRDSSTA